MWYEASKELPATAKQSNILSTTVLGCDMNENGLFICYYDYRAKKWCDFETGEILEDIRIDLWSYIEKPTLVFPDTPLRHDRVPDGMLED